MLITLLSCMCDLGHKLTFQYESIAFLYTVNHIILSLVSLKYYIVLIIAVTIYLASVLWYYMSGCLSNSNTLYAVYVCVCVNVNMFVCVQVCAGVYPCNYKLCACVCVCIYVYPKGDISGDANNTSVRAYACVCTVAHTCVVTRERACLRDGAGSRQGGFGGSGGGGGHLKSENTAA